ncbi:MAG: hypothetical protein P0Y64_04380 [Candidatus Sphingomonas colombiensis]|nr:hypothetical protein [Sphingomonas sp.]WEK44076.1 MAG: hypothetical protein P0Y64_04380 [Sphingomonas sp.]
MALAFLSTAAAAQITITPRFSGYFDNSSQQQTTAQVAFEQGTVARIAATNAQLRELFGAAASFDVADNQIVSGGNQIFFPLYGASITFSPTGNQLTQLTLTALHGSTASSVSAISRSTQRLSVLGTTAEDLLVTSSRGRVRSSRLDLEATLQHRLNETFSFVGGVRLERVRSALSVSGEFAATQNGTNLVNALLGGPIDLGLSVDRFSATSEGTSNTFGARIGAAAFIPVDQRNLVYVNGLLHLSHLAEQRLTLATTFARGDDAVRDETRRPSETTVGPDISVGYLRRFSERVALDLRYRGVFYFPVSGPRNFDDPRVSHGVNIGLSYIL